RRFRIRNAPPEGDDYYNLNQALRRRFNHRDWKTPDLIVIDGGKGQLSAALEAQKVAPYPEYQSVPIIALAKKEEEVFVPYQSEPLFISKPSRALRLLQRIRDEAHRFAVQYHQNLRRKSHVPGPKKRR
ncbi:MAG: excinuclease ABC subunit C, partial [Candidatus Paceibacteria bacterium]